MDKKIRSYIKFILITYLLLFVKYALSNPSEELNHIVVTTAPLVSKVQLYGRIVPLDIVNLSASTIARIDKIYVQLGQKVEKDQLLLELTSDQLDIDIRNAKEILIRSQMEFNKKQSWQNSDEVFQAKQSNAKYKLNFKRAEDTYTQNKLLFKQGIISHNELEQSAVTYNDAKLNLDVSNRHLNQILNQGNAIQLNLLQLALDNAQAKLDILENIKNKLSIKSPIAGVILRANNPEKINKNTPFLALGQNVSSGENLLAIGNFNGFAINIYANEQIIQHVQLNQAVQITIPALTTNNSYNGIITAIDAQPKDNDTTVAPPTYNIRVVADNSQIAHKIFLGMTSKISFDIIEQEKAILVPFSSIAYNEHNQAYVINYKDKTKHLVTLGKTAQNKIEIVDGLKSGDIILKSATV
jgi:HlyD family secretion protein